MTKRLLTRALLLIALVSGMAFAAPANAEVTVRGEVGFFYDSLAPYGSWVNVAAYGDVWVPRVPTWWRPYSEGHWVFTDDGWCWVDDEPWGWATFHYGRWFLDPEYGWAWVPGTVWAPAWVAWRWGDGFVGWAPLPPQVGWSAGFGLSFEGGDFDAMIAPHNWCFVDERHFTDPRIHGYLAPTTRNVTYVRMTRNVTNYSVVNNRVFDRGVDIRQVERFTGRPVPRLHIVDSRAPGVRATARELNVYRPSFTRNSERRRGPRVEPAGRPGAAVAPRNAQRPPAESPRSFDARGQQERTRLQSEERARVSRGASTQQLHGRQTAERQAVARQQPGERRGPDPRVKQNTNAKAIRGRAPDRGVQHKPAVSPARGKAPASHAQQNAAHAKKGNAKAQGKGNGPGGGNG